MSGSSAPMAKAEKSMSSRLLTMKFMQRAAASSPSSPQTPEQSSPKRQKLFNDFSPATPSADLQAIQAALAAEEAKRSEALERQAAEAGESKWVLSFQPENASLVDGASENGLGSLRIINASFSGLDRPLVSTEQAEEVSRSSAVVGRRSFGKFNRALEKRQNGNDGSSSSSEEDASESANQVDGDEDDDPAGTKALIQASREEATQRAKAERKAQRRAAKFEAAQLATRRKSKEVKLNKLGSISGGGGGMNASRECFRCGNKGHKKDECPQIVLRQKRKKESYNEHDRSNKSRKPYL
ncbi:MAG: hypothetical protein M1830_005788 [Pleopsidium flavum]|nr:MAG: hypothetical protein M1830_005788 [Pleopsidium flavum]